MLGQGIKVKCKRCGKEALAASFVLDPVYRLMVCPGCVKDRRNAALNVQMKSAADAQAAEKKKNEPPRPAGWDAEDEFLEKSYKMKQRETVVCQRIDADRVNYKCPKCKYTFPYNMITKRPAMCPYCSTDILRVNTQ